MLERASRATEATVVPERASGAIEAPVNSLAEIRLSRQSLDSLLGHIGRLGVAALDGWEAAGTSVVEGHRVASFGVTDERVSAVDQYQYDHQVGPCLTSIKTGEAQYFPDGDEPAADRDFARFAGETGVRSILSFPLKVDDSILGAINFYSSRPDALQRGQWEDGLVFATQAAISVANLEEFRATRRQVDQLEEGLKTRTVIGQATGLLMAQEGLTSQEAFQKLVQVSQTANVKLRDIAVRYVEAWEAKRGSNGSRVSQT